MITSNSFAKKYGQLAKALNRRVKAYLKDPHADNVHRLRTATRRLQAAFELLPKTARNEKKANRAMARVKKLMKVNATVRDQDIILSKLSGYQQNSTYDKLIEDLRKSRKSHLEQARSLASSLQKNPIPSVKARELSEPALLKRYNKVVRKLSTRITSDLPIIREDPDKIEELHVLRRNGKQLRYVLEMPEFVRPSKSLVALRSWQDLLGAIRDHDVMNDYLKGLEKSPEIQAALGTETGERNRNYRKFVLASRDNPVSRIAGQTRREI